MYLEVQYIPTTADYANNVLILYVSLRAQSQNDQSIEDLCSNQKLWKSEHQLEGALVVNHTIQQHRMAKFCKIVIIVPTGKARRKPDLNTKLLLGEILLGSLQ